MSINLNDLWGESCENLGVRRSGKKTARAKIRFGVFKKDGEGLELKVSEERVGGNAGQGELPAEIGFTCK